MDCDICQEALSARADGEAEPVAAEVTDAHLASCAACRRWQQDVAALTRGLRVRPAVDVPDLTARVLAAAAASDGPAPTPRGWYPRVALAGIAVAQLTLGLAQVFGVSDGDSHAGHAATSSHLFNESTAWNLALGLGMLWTALRPTASSGLLPVMAGFVAVLTPFSAHDLLAGSAPLSRITSHAFLVLGLVVLLVVHRGRHTPEDGPRATGVTGPPLDLDDGEEEDRRPDRGEDDGGRRRHLRPVGRRHAA